MAGSKHEPGEESKVPAAARPAYDAVVALTDTFCREHLTDEYKALCRKLAAALARKRPSPLLGGKPTTWACGIVRTIGWVNYLDDKASKPHMKLPAIDKAFGVAESTGQGKSKAIRELFKIRTLDPQWVLPSRMDENPRAWMIQIHGFLVDARILKREAQEEAFKKGLIPFIPGDRSGRPVEE
ncbi:DUF6398 domain-containing protein [Singulisphaera rosea]